MSKTSEQNEVINILKQKLNESKIQINRKISTLNQKNTQELVKKANQALKKAKIDKFIKAIDHYDIVSTRHNDDHYGCVVNRALDNNSEIKSLRNRLDSNQEKFEDVKMSIMLNGLTVDNRKLVTDFIKTLKV